MGYSIDQAGENYTVNLQPIIWISGKHSAGRANGLLPIQLDRTDFPALRLRVEKSIKNYYSTPPPRFSVVYASQRKIGGILISPNYKVTLPAVFDRPSPATGAQQRVRPPAGFDNRRAR